MGLFNSGPFNVSPLNAGIGGSDAVTGSIGGYRLELTEGFLGNNALIAQLDKLLPGASLKQAVNEPTTLSIALPEAYAYESQLRRPHEIRVVDSSGHYWESFLIHEVTRRSDGNIRTVQVECQNYFSYLNDYVVAAIDSPRTDVEGASPKTVQEIIDEILAYTDGRLAAAIDEAIASRPVSISFRSMTCLEAITRLFEAVGSVGYYWVYGQHFFWSLGDSVATHYLNENRIASWSESLDYTQCVTRLYAYGRGNDRDTRITLKDAGHPTEYIESANISTIGEFEAVTEYDVADADELLASAQYDLAKMDEPISTFECTAADLSQIPEYVGVVTPFALVDAIRIDREGELATVAVITGLDIDLGNPVLSRITVTNRKQTFFSKLASKLVEAKRGEATELYGSTDADKLPDTFVNGAPTPDDPVNDPAEGSAWPGVSDLAAREDHGPHLTMAAISEAFTWGEYTP